MNHDQALAGFGSPDLITLLAACRLRPALCC
jgi:hypothetical protein